MAQSIMTPDQIYGELFTAVQEKKIFADSKTFVDCIPKKDPAAILADYRAAVKNPNLRFSLRLFVEENFIVPHIPESDFISPESDMIKHIESLWTILRRKNDSTVEGSSLLPLPYEYIVPGGRFREVYYWDSYFTLLGLHESGKDSLLEDMVRNFAYLISTYGHIPNGNRSYYLSRSQPPCFSLMVDLLAGVKGEAVYKEYLPQLQKEYDYWMDRSAPTSHQVKMPDGSQLNRYWDQLTIPRQESYLEDEEVARHRYPESHPRLFRDLRSAAESGWDFSSRWLEDFHSLQTIETTSIIPVDLNSLLYHLEKTIGKALALSSDTKGSAIFTSAAEARKKALNKYCWSATTGWFMDYNIAKSKQTRAMTIAGMFPFFFSIADGARASSAAAVIKKTFLKPGGVVTTPLITGHQWDAPNGWAPLQWVTIQGLNNYGQKDLAATIARRWIDLNTRTFKTTGRLMEKYDVIDMHKPAGGGEYPSQDGFGWTNGVLLALIHQYGSK